MDRPIMRGPGVFHCTICNTSAFFGEADFWAHVNGLLHQTTKARLSNPHIPAPLQSAQVENPRMTFDYGHGSSTGHVNEEKPQQLTFDYGHSSNPVHPSIHPEQQPTPMFSGGMEIPQRIISGGIEIPQRNFSGGMEIPQPNVSGGMQIPQQKVFGNTQVQKPKSLVDEVPLPADSIDEPVLLEDGRYLCKICDLKLETSENVKSHIYGMKHLKMKKFRLLPIEDRAVDIGQGILICPRCGWSALDCTPASYMAHLQDSQHLLAVKKGASAAQQKVVGHLDESVGEISQDVLKGPDKDWDIAIILQVNGSHMCKVCREETGPDEEKFWQHLASRQHKAMKEFLVLPKEDKSIAQIGKKHKCPKCSQVTEDVLGYMEHFSKPQHLATIGVADAEVQQEWESEVMKDAEPMVNGCFRCKICSIAPFSKAQYIVHYKGFGHQRQLQFLETVSKLDSTDKQFVQQQNPSTVKCTLCDMVLSTSTMLAHFQGKSHEHNKSLWLASHEVQSSLNEKTGGLKAEIAEEYVDIGSGKLRCKKCGTAIPVLQYKAHILGKTHRLRLIKMTKPHLYPVASTGMPTALTCPICNDDHPNIEVYEKHLKAKHPDESEPVKSTLQMEAENHKFEPGDEPIMDGNKYTCPSCNVIMWGLSTYMIHILQGKKHARNKVKFLEGQKPSNSQEEESKSGDAKPEQDFVWDRVEEPVVLENNKYICPICEVSMFGKNTYNTHVKDSKKHARLKTQFLLKNPDGSVPPPPSGVNSPDFRNVFHPKLMMMSDLQNSNQYMLGLENIIEWQLTRKKNPVKYLCQLCKAHPDQPMEHLTSANHMDNYFAKYYPDIHQHILTTKDPTLCQQLRLEYTKGIMQTVPLGQPYAMLALHEHEIKKFHADPRMVTHHEQTWLCLQFDVKEGKEVVPTERVVLPWKKDREKKEKKDTAGMTEDVPPPPAAATSQDSDIIAASPWMAPQTRPIQLPHMVVEDTHEKFGGMQTTKSDPASQAAPISGNSFKTFNIDAATQGILSTFLDNMEDTLKTEKVADNDVVAVLCGEALTNAAIARVCLQLSTTITKALQEFRKSAQSGQASGPITSEGQAAAAKSIPKTLMKAVFQFKKDHPGERLTATVSVQKTVEELNQLKEKTTLKRHLETPQGSTEHTDVKKPRESDKKENDNKKDKDKEDKGRDRKKSDRDKRKHESDRERNQRERERSRRDSGREKKERDRSHQSTRDRQRSPLESKKDNKDVVDMEVDSPAPAENKIDTLATLFSEHSDVKDSGEIHKVLTQLIEECSLTDSQISLIVKSVKQVMQLEGQEINIEQMLAQIAPLIMASQAEGDSETTTDESKAAKPEGHGDERSSDKNTSVSPSHSEFVESSDHQDKELKSSELDKKTKEQAAGGRHGGKKSRNPPAHSSQQSDVVDQSSMPDDAIMQQQQAGMASFGQQQPITELDTSSSIETQSKRRRSERRGRGKRKRMATETKNESDHESVDMDLDSSPTAGNATDSLMRLLCEYGGAEMEMLQSTLEALIKQQSLTESQIAHITDVVREVLESSTEMNVELLLARITPLLQGNDTETNSQAATKPDDLESTPRTENLQGKDTKSKWDVSQPVGSMHMASIPAAGQSSVPYLTAGSQAATVLTQPLPQPSAPSHELTNLFGGLGALFATEEESGTLQSAILQMIQQSSLSESQLEQVIMMVQQLLAVKDHLTEDELMLKLAPALTAIMGQVEKDSGDNVLASSVQQMMLPPGAPSATMPPPGALSAIMTPSGAPSSMMPLLGAPSSVIPQPGMPPVLMPPPGAPLSAMHQQGSVAGTTSRSHTNSNPSQQTMMPASASSQKSNSPPGASMLFPSAVHISSSVPTDRPPQAATDVPDVRYPASTKTNTVDQRMFSDSSYMPKGSDERRLWIGSRDIKRDHSDVRSILSKSDFNFVLHHKGWFIIAIFKTHREAAATKEQLHRLKGIEVKFYQPKKDKEKNRRRENRRRDSTERERESRGSTHSDFFPYDQDPLRLIIRRAAKLPVGSSIISEFVPKAIAVDFGRDRDGSYAVAEFRDHEDAEEGRQRLLSGACGEKLSVKFKPKSYDS